MITIRLPAVLLAALTFCSVDALAEEEPKQSSADAGLSICLRVREQIFQCKEAFADAFVQRRNPPPDQREPVRQRVLEEITADGAGPIERRRQRCSSSWPARPPEWSASAKKTLDACGAITDCRKRVPCIRELLIARRAEAMSSPWQR